MIHAILTERNIEARLAMEGDTDHRADYEGTACLNEEEFGQLLGVAGPDLDTAFLHIIQTAHLQRLLRRVDDVLTY
ncbi:hypothetical protein [Paenibacillus sp. 843]|uniref:hypothetical protein n=1 Tax=Paenibacillus sp. 843 TaxID=3341795 RepID=UPI00372D367C